MNKKRVYSLFVVICMVLSLFPKLSLAEEYISLKDLADANGYEYFSYEDKESVNMRSASYILSFQNNNNIVAYKTVLGDVGTITLNTEVIERNNILYISKLDSQTKLIKYFPNTPSTVISQSSTKEAEIEPLQDSLVGSDRSIPSDWAAAEVNDARNNGLVTANVQKNYKANITREYFCELVVRLYERTTGESVQIDRNPFYDTNNSEVLKAYKLGIVNGVTDTEFMPDNYITRQEICAMLVRAIKAIYQSIDIVDYSRHSFIDGDMISSWAYDSVQFAYDNRIIQGINDKNTEIDPLGHATCEQSILLVNRIYENRAKFEKRNDNSEKVIETLKHFDFSDDSEVKSVNISFSDDRSTSNIRVKEIDKKDLIYQTTGIKGTAVEISPSGTINNATATISFEYNPDGLGDTNPYDLAVAWYNTDLGRIEVLSSNINSSAHTVSVQTEHFSEYVLVDSKKWYSVWQRGQTIVRETDNNGNNLKNFVTIQYTLIRR